MLRRTSAIIAVVILAAVANARAADVKFEGAFKRPALATIWAALNQPTAAEMALEWHAIEPRKDAARPGDFWRQWPGSFSPFYAGVKLPADGFTLAQLYPNRKLVYPQATYDGSPDYQ